MTSNVSTLSKSPEDNNEGEASEGDPIALLNPVLQQDDVGNETANGLNLSKSFDLVNSESDPYLYQTHETTIFEHKLQVNESELSEFMEKIVITKRDPKLPQTDLTQNVLLHRRKIDNLELIIKTIATQNDEIIDFNLNTHVYENNGISISSRSMCKDELKRFKTTWRKLWRPNFSDNELYNYALLDIEMQPQRDIRYPIESKIDTLTNVSRRSKSKYPSYQNSKKKSQNSRNSNPSNRSSSSGKSDGKSQKSNEGESRAGKQASLGLGPSTTGWETYVDPSEHQ